MHASVAAQVGELGVRLKKKIQYVSKQYSKKLVNSILRFTFLKDTYLEANLALKWLDAGVDVCMLL